jgi:rhodanese-related sulfurtransferase
MNLAILSLALLTAGPVPQTEPQALQNALLSGAPVRVVDLRGPSEHAASHIPGAAEASVWALSRDGALRRQSLVVVDFGLPGGPADQVAATLSAQGVRISVLRGGYRAWCEAGLPTSAPCGRVDVVPVSEAAHRKTVSASAVNAAIAAGGVVLAVPDDGPLPAPRPGVFWLAGGDAALQALRAPGAPGAATRVDLLKPWGSALGTDAKSCGCQR